MSRGTLVVLEGVDRSGKSTQTLKLIESLKKRNIKAERMVFPDRTTWTGQAISQYLSSKECKLNDQAIHLLFSANRWENTDKIEDRLRKGITLVVDRYSYSGVAFSVAKGMDSKWCMQPEIGLPKPDLVFLLNVNPQDLKDRPGFGAERYETVPLQLAVSEIFKRFAQSDDTWKIVDANRDFEEIHADLLNDVVKKVEVIRECNPPLQYLADCSDKTNDVLDIASTEKRQKLA